MIKIRCANCDEIFEVSDDAETGRCPECGTEQELDIEQIVFPEEEGVIQESHVQQNAQEYKREPVQEKYQERPEDVLENLIYEAGECMRSGAYRDASWKYLEIVNRDPKRKEQDYRVAWGMALCEAVAQRESMEQADPAQEEQFDRLYAVMKAEPALKRALAIAPEAVREELEKQYQDRMAEYQKRYQEMKESARRQRIEERADQIVRGGESVLVKIEKLKELAGQYPEMAETCRSRENELKTQYQESFHIMDVTSEEELHTAEIMFAGNARMQESIRLRRDMLREQKTVRERNIYKKICENLNEGSAFSVNFSKLLPGKKPDEKMIWNQTIADMMSCWLKFTVSGPAAGISFQDELRGQAFTSQYRIHCMEQNYQAGAMEKEQERLEKWSSIMPGGGMPKRKEAPGEEEFIREFKSKSGETKMARTLILGVGAYIACYIVFGVIGTFFSIFSYGLGDAIAGMGGRCGFLAMIFVFVRNWKQIRMVFMSQKEYVNARKRESQAAYKQQEEKRPTFVIMDPDGRYHITEVK